MRKSKRGKETVWDVFMENNKNLPMIVPNKETKLPNITEIMAHREESSPDWEEIKLYENVVLFVYDNMKRGYDDNTLLSEAKYLGKATTTTSKWLLKKTFDEEVVAFKTLLYTHSQGGTVTGEAYAVKPEFLAYMDRVKGEKYKRERHFVRLTEQSVAVASNLIPSVPCFSYVGVDKVWDRLNERLMLCPASIRTNNERNYEYYSTSNHYRNPNPMLSSEMNRVLFDQNGFPVERDWDEDGFSFGRFPYASLH